jgi:hypothetical protein
MPIAFANVLFREGEFNRSTQHYAPEELCGVTLEQFLH